MSGDDYNFKNLVFEGGGVKGIAYAGALRIVEKKGILDKIERVAGTSAGAITAALISVGYSPQEIEKALDELDFSSFKDDSTLLVNLFSLLKRYGWYKGNTFEKWLKDMISKKVSPNITFSQLNELKKKDPKIRDLYVVGTDLNNKRSVIFSKETSPNMPIFEAVRISMSIPLFFKSISYDDSIYVDGGVYYNYPINLFDKSKYLSDAKKNNKEVYNKETLGFRVDSSEEIKIRKKKQLTNSRINSLKEYIQALIGGLTDMANKIHLKEKDWHRTIYIDSLGISATQFDLSNKQKEDLISSGLESAQSYFKWFDNSKGKEKPLNK